MGGALARGGWCGFADGSSRPRRHPTATPVRTISAIVRLRHLGLPAWQIARRVGRPRSTVSVILQRVGLGRLTVPTPPPQRYEWPHAGDLLHLDIKPLGRFHAIGHRMHGNRRVRSRGAGWEYVHVAIDDATRVAFVEVVPKQNGDATADFLARAIAWFARQGIQIRRVMSDNGSGYLSRPSGARVRSSPFVICGPGPTRLGRTARRNASFRRCSGNGPMLARIARLPVAPTRWPGGSRTTTGSVPMRVLTTALPGHDSRPPNEQRV